MDTEIMNEETNITPVSINHNQYEDDQPSRSNQESENDSDSENETKPEIRVIEEHDDYQKRSKEIDKEELSAGVDRAYQALDRSNGLECVWQEVYFCKPNRNINGNATNSSSSTNSSSGTNIKMTNKLYKTIMSKMEILTNLDHQNLVAMMNFWVDYQFSDRHPYEEHEWHDVEKAFEIYDIDNEDIELLTTKLLTDSATATSSIDRKVNYRLVFITEFLDAGTLDAHYRDVDDQSNSPSRDTQVRWLVQLLSALDHLHSSKDAPIVHHNLSCKTVFRHHNGNFKLGGYWYDTITRQILGKNEKVSQGYYDKEKKNRHDRDTHVSAASSQAGDGSFDLAKDPTVTVNAIALGSLANNNHNNNNNNNNLEITSKSPENGNLDPNLNRRNEVQTPDSDVILQQQESVISNHTSDQNLTSSNPAASTTTIESSSQTTCKAKLLNSTSTLTQNVSVMTSDTTVVGNLSNGTLCDSSTTLSSTNQSSSLYQLNGNQSTEDLKELAVVSENKPLVSLNNHNNHNHIINTRTPSIAIDLFAFGICAMIINKPTIMREIIEDRRAKRSNKKGSSKNSSGNEVADALSSFRTRKKYLAPIQKSDEKLANMIELCLNSSKNPGLTARKLLREPALVGIPTLKLMACRMLIHQNEELEDTNSLFLWFGKVNGERFSEFLCF